MKPGMPQRELAGVAIDEVQRHRQRHVDAAAHRDVEEVGVVAAGEGRHHADGHQRAEQRTSASAPASDLLRLARAEQPFRPQQQDQDQHREGHGIAVGGTTDRPRRRSRPARARGRPPRHRRCCRCHPAPPRRRPSCPAACPSADRWRDSSAAYRMPPAAASAEPSAKVKEITRSLLMPTSEAATGLNDSARMAVPVRVCSTM